LRSVSIDPPLMGTHFPLSEPPPPLHLCVLRLEDMACKGLAFFPAPCSVCCGNSFSFPFVFLVFSPPSPPPINLPPGTSLVFPPDTPVGMTVAPHVAFFPSFCPPDPSPFSSVCLLFVPPSVGSSFCFDLQSFLNHQAPLVRAGHPELPPLPLPLSTPLKSWTRLSWIFVVGQTLFVPH